MKTDTRRKFRFREFQVYKDSRKFSIELKKLSGYKFPATEQFGLKSQLWRALDSIILNIAEGSDRSTDKDFALFLNRSHTSLNEVVSCLDVSLDNKYISQDDHSLFLKKSCDLADQLTAFRNKLLKDSKKIGRQ